MCAQKDIWAAATSDADPMLHGCPRTITNLTISQRKKLPSGASVGIKSHLIELDEMLKTLGLNRDQLIALGILVGTDYNPGGVYRIGPKKALKKVKEFKTVKQLDGMFKDMDVDFDWKEIYDLFKNMEINKKYDLKWGSPDVDKVSKLLVDKHDFSQDRVDNTLSKIMNVKAAKGNKKLDKWFK